MTYDKTEWFDNPPSKATPITAERLNHLETQYDEAVANIESQVSDSDSPIGSVLSETYATIGDLNDAVIGTFDPTGLLTKVEAEVTYVARPTGPIKPFPLGDYLNGEAMPNDGVLNASPALARAVLAASNWHLSGASTSFRSGGIPAVVTVPDGAFRTVTALIPYSGVGIVGAGRDRTIFYPEGNQALIEGPLWDSEPVGGWTFYDDQLFADFTIDGIRQSASPDFGGTKGMYYQNARRIRFNRVAMRNTWASSFGIDFIIDGQATDCYVYRSGRGATVLTNTGPTTSGFAPGTGRFDNESMIWTNCIAEECYGAGWLMEQIVGRNAFLQPPAFTLVNCRGIKNKYGVSDLGTGGLSLIGCNFEFNTHSGLFVGGASGRAAGRYGRAVGCTFYKNGGYVDNPGKSGNGVTFMYGDGAHGWEFDACFFRENFYSGIHLQSGLDGRKGGLRVRGGAFVSNIYGIHMERAKYTLPGLLVDGSLFRSNTGAGIWIDTPLLAPQIVNCTFDGSTQPVGVSWSPNYPSTKSIVKNNTFVDQAITMSNTPSDNSQIANNVTTTSIDAFLAATAGSAPVYIADSSSDNIVNVNGLSWNSAQDSTTYVAFDGIPTSGGTYLVIRDASNQTKITFDRASGNLNWRAVVRNSAGAVTAASLAAPAGKAVLCAVRSENSVTLYVYGVGNSTAAVAGWPTVPTVSSVQRNGGAAYATTFNGAHDSTKRDAIMARLAADFITV